MVASPLTALKLGCMLAVSTALLHPVQAEDLSKRRHEAARKALAWLVKVPEPNLEKVEGWEDRYWAISTSLTAWLLEIEGNDPAFAEARQQFRQRADARA